ncbi:hypothetical protein [Rubrolithibacter danxiaensis]|uniref:hypothetical protein n=1 Tax=Rubrolithibacter danxiaensis TaxID=3390805 RepID=UPI003BF90991
MIEFLKESTFAVNDVLRTAWQILKKQYLPISGLCFLMFVTSIVSAFLASLFAGVNPVLSLIMALLFIVLYFGLYLTMFKYILTAVDFSDENIDIQRVLPTLKQLGNFFIATFYFLLSFAFIFLIILALVYIVDVVGVKSDLVVTVALSLTLIISFIIGLRISFFPFFIIDKDSWPFQAIKFSLAITRGNFTRLIILLGFLALFQVLSLYFIKIDYLILGIITVIVNYFLIVPLSGVALAVAYRNMMNEYQGDQDPDILHNII